MNVLTKIIPVYVNYTTKDGNPGVRARTWHPAWFMPVFKIWLRYWMDAPRRYKAYQNALAQIGRYTTPGAPVDKVACVVTINKIAEIIESIECGYDCDYEKPYGFVPEAGCPIHD